MAPELLYSLLASTTMLGCWVGLRVGLVLGSAGGAGGTVSGNLVLHCAVHHTEQESHLMSGLCCISAHMWCVRGIIAGMAAIWHDVVL